MTKKKSAIPSRIAELKSELNRLEVIQEHEVINNYYPKIKEKYEGKYFKVRNGYNSKDRWWLYTKIVEIKPEDVYDTKGNGVTSHFTGWTFKLPTDGKIDISQVKHGYVHHLGHEISEEEFNAAWNKMIEKLNSLK